MRRLLPFLALAFVLLPCGTQVEPFSKASHYMSAHGFQRWLCYRVTGEWR